MKELSGELRAAIEELKHAGTTQDSGVVIRVGDGICWIYGLSKAGYNEMIEIEATDGSRITAFALNLMQDEIGAVILGEDTKIKAGSKVHLTGKVLEIPVGPELVGRVVNPLGQAIDGGAPIKRKHTGLIEQEFLKPKEEQKLDQTIIEVRHPLQRSNHVRKPQTPRSRRFRRNRRQDQGTEGTRAAVRAGFEGRLQRGG